MAIRLPSLYVADPNEILRPVKPWFIAADARRWRCC